MRFKFRDGVSAEFKLGDIIVTKGGDILQIMKAVSTKYILLDLTKLQVESYEYTSPNELVDACIHSTDIMRVIPSSRIEIKEI